MSEKEIREAREKRKDSQYPIADNLTDGEGELQSIREEKCFLEEKGSCISI